ncbi:uncharacterized protein BDZ99DRAFT_475375 [Mytilinidion resinicola]|uniref:Histone chaperone domain-containing protein n=1 Tax=Mytilinidion resinicola TaxID=574789 RepID=A0A6A6YV92_9PEZI|nr:uncharacterized protein BDZ99DRAFT_475375 [Mytilinidion resinicola]KAF2811877.1 hypothetical protein BDZ99DRAFT_475375 [Mytilinidion resinicola]
MGDNAADHKMEDDTAMQSPATGTIEKGKGKAAEQQPDLSMDEESSDEEESGAENETAEPEDEDTMEEINTDNIINDGRRTRGKSIDFKKAAAELDDDDEEDDDEDFQDPDDAMEE